MAEPAEVVRSINDSFNTSGVDAASELFAADVVFDPSGVLPEAEAFEGIDATTQVVHAWIATFEEFRIEAEEIVPSGPDRVLAVVRDGGRLAGSAAPIDNQFFHVWTISGGKVRRWETFASRPAAQQRASAPADEP